MVLLRCWSRGVVVKVESKGWCGQVVCGWVVGGEEGRGLGTIKAGYA